MKCQILFSRKNKKSIISLSSAEFAHSMISVNTYFQRLLGPTVEKSTDPNQAHLHSQARSTTVLSSLEHCLVKCSWPIASF